VKAPKNCDPGREEQVRGGTRKKGVCSPRNRSLVEKTKKTARGKSGGRKCLGLGAADEGGSGGKKTARVAWRNIPGDSGGGVGKKSISF